MSSMFSLAPIHRNTATQLQAAYFHKKTQEAAQKTVLISGAVQLGSNPNLHEELYATVGSSQKRMSVCDPLHFAASQKLLFCLAWHRSIRDERDCSWIGD